MQNVIDLSRYVDSQTGETVFWALDGLSKAEKLDMLNWIDTVHRSRQRIDSAVTGGMFAAIMICTMILYGAGGLWG